MSVEQYFGGRIRYIQVGDNGNAAPGIGCYAKSRGVSGQDESEIRRRYTQYLNTQKNMKGKCPTIYKRAILPTGIAHSVLKLAIWPSAWTPASVLLVPLIWIS